MQYSRMKIVMKHGVKLSLFVCILLMIGVSSRAYSSDHPGWVIDIINGEKKVIRPDSKHEEKEVKITIYESHTLNGEDFADWFFGKLQNGYAAI